MQRTALVERWRRRAAGPSGLMEFLFFAWVNPILLKGSTQPLEQEDLLPLAPLHEPAHNQARLWDFWTQEQAQNENPRLIRAILRVYGARYFGIAALKLLNDSLNFAGPILLNVLVTYLSQPVASPGGGDIPNSIDWSKGWFQACWAAFKASWDPQGPWLGYWCAGLLFATCILKAFLNTHYNYQLSVLTCRLRSALMCSLYRKALMLRSVDLDGHLHTLMAVDSATAVNLLLSFHELWSLPLQIAVAFYMLFMQVRFCFVAGIVVCVLMIPVNRWIALRIQSATVLMMKHKDTRISAIAQLLEGIRTVKMLAWEDVLAQKVQQHRAAEMSALATRKYLDALCVYFWVATSGLFSLFTFGLMVLVGQPLTPAVVFTSLALFNILITPLNAFPWVINGVMEAVVSLGRLRQFLQLPHSENISHQLLASSMEAYSGSPRHSHGEGSSGSSGTLDRTYSGRVSPSQHSTSGAAMPRVKDADKPWIIRVAAAQLEGAWFSWGGQDGPPCLHDLSLCLLSGIVTSVVGQVGSGKSSFLAALMGELPLTKGTCNIRPGKVGYVSQNPWLISGTIKENILLGQPFNEQLYYDVLTACALDQDLAQMQAGDDTVMGDRGCTLSGGQRVRVALARVLYQRCDLFLLDDILAAVDQQCAAWIIQHVLGGTLLEYRTVVVSTKSMPCIAASQHVVYLEKGKLVYAGSSSQFLEQHAAGFLPHASAITEDEHDFFIKCQTKFDAEDALDVVSCGGPVSRNALNPSPISPNSLDKQQDQEEREVGHVKLHVYRRYFQAVGWGLVIGVAVSLLLMQLTRNGNDLWISYWVGHTQCCSPTLAKTVCPGPPLYAIPHPKMMTSSSTAGAVAFDPSMGAVSQTAAALPPAAAGLMTGPPVLQNHNSTGHHGHAAALLACTPFTLFASRAALGSVCSKRSNSGRRGYVGGAGSARPPKMCRQFMAGKGKEGKKKYSESGAPSLVLVSGSSVSQASARLYGNLMLEQPLWRFSTLTQTAAATHWTPAGDHNHSRQEDASSASVIFTGTQQPTAQQTMPGADQVIVPSESESVDVVKAERLDGSEGVATRKMRVHGLRQLEAADNLEVEAHHHKHASNGPSYTIPPAMYIFLKGLVVIAVVNTVCTLARAFMFAFAGLEAASHMHSKLLQNVLALPLRVFETLPVGRFINRFSSDVNTVDDSLPFMLNILLANAVSLLGALGLMATAQPLMLAALLPLMFLYRWIQHRYQASAREIRRLDSLTLSPIYSSFAEVLEGSACIRGLKLIAHFALGNIASIAANQQAAITAAVVSNWLNLRLQLLAAVLVGAVGVLGAASKHGMLPAGYSTWDAGLVGLSLSYALPIVSLLNGLLTSSAETEQEMVAVERICQYLDLPAQPQQLPAANSVAGIESGRHTQQLSVPVVNCNGNGVVSTTGPDGLVVTTSAVLEVQDVFLQYGPTLPWALRGVHFRVLHGEKVGICGRTGAGKSSVISSILRLVEIQQGAVLYNGTDVRTIPLQRLRRALGVVPQTPFLFEGSVKQNLDPTDSASDEALRAILQDVQMWDALVEMVEREGIVVSTTYPPASTPTSAPFPMLSHPLDDPYTASHTTPLLRTPSQLTDNTTDPLTTAVLSFNLQTGAKTLSHGQRQLLCLARVLVKQTDLFLLDECTAGVDPRTAAVMQAVLTRRADAGCAVLQVAHDLDAILSYDQVFVMEGGQVAERGPPKQLLNVGQSKFGTLWRRSCC